jgi:integrase
VSANIDRVDVRARLKVRRDPYWRRLSKGRYVGFRRLTSTTPGTWLARCYDGGRYDYEPLGDFATIGEKERFDAAKRAAEEWFRHLDMGGSTDRQSVKAACEAYIDKLKLESSEASSNDAKGRFARLVYADPIARIELAKLAPRHLADWKKRVLERGGTRGSYNRNATALRAALNLAYERRNVASDHAWREELKPLENAAGRRNLYLDRAARRKLIEKAAAEVRPLLTTLALLPMRPGDPAKLLVGHFNSKHRVLSVPTGKTKAREVPLPQEALTHFKACAKGKLPAAWLISKADGAQWTKEAWRDAIKEAAKAAKLPTGTCAYTLRHSAITDLVTGGLDLFTIAKISGTSVQMIEKHYGHLQREHARKGLEVLALS